MNTQFAAPQRIEIAESQSSFLRPISRAESSRPEASWPKRIRAFGIGIAHFIHWIAKASIIRSVAPGARAQERHEFESIQSRRGGFGNVF
ncbi:hypothetical protein BH10BDE1_BH10BDE1_09180 [soil metagenome]